MYMNGTITGKKMSKKKDQSPILQALLESGRRKENTVESTAARRFSASAVSSSHISRGREGPSTYFGDNTPLPALVNLNFRDNPHKTELVKVSTSENDSLSTQRQIMELVDQTQVLTMPKHDPSDNPSTTRIKLHLAYVFYSLARATATSNGTSANKE
ncbi:hypothetical protein Y032_0107g3814 [Ancylostoma ceylanicum]|uniref:Uncharacterized protein n=1 Tax=Ancylostoma ceylanicum TaxID=53326 RepID=A0A016TFM7_9BILA|nr:hypothetical protein Y032_0107g3814 [Ancylostoma ceylanicum]